jgi:hypothetical protein
MPKLSKRGTDARLLISKWMNDRFHGKRSRREVRVSYGRTLLAKTPKLTAYDVLILDAHIRKIA